jgi:hypothetical protein
MASSLIGGCVPRAVSTSSSFVTAPICAKMDLNNESHGRRAGMVGDDEQDPFALVLATGKACATSCGALRFADFAADGADL